MKQKKRWMAVILVTAMAAILPLNISGLQSSATQSASAEGTQPYYFEHDFEDIPVGYLQPNGNWGLPAPNQYWHTDIGGSSIQIDYQPDGDGKSLTVGKGTRLYHWLDEIPEAEKDQFVVSLDLKIPNIYTTNSDFWLGFSQTGFVKLNSDTYGQYNYGQIAGSVGSKGWIDSNKWAAIALAVDRTAGKYDVYLNRVKVVSAQEITGNILWNCFTIHNFMEEPVYIDNVKAYGGAYIGEEPAPEVELGKALVYDTYDDLRVQTLSGRAGYVWPFANRYIQYSNHFNSAPSQVEIAYDAERGSNVLKITKSGDAPSDGSFILHRSLADASDLKLVESGFTVRFDMKISDLHNNNWIFGFGEGECDLIDFTPAWTYGCEGSWQAVTVLVDKQAQTYDLYVGTRKIVSQKEWTGDGSGDFVIKTNWNNGSGNGSTLLFDNLLIYPGVYPPA